MQNCIYLSNEYVCLLVTHIYIHSTTGGSEHAGNVLQHLNVCAAFLSAAITSQAGSAKGGNGGETVHQTGLANVGTSQTRHQSPDPGLSGRSGIACAFVHKH